MDHGSSESQRQASRADTVAQSQREWRHPTVAWRSCGTVLLCAWGKAPEPSRTVDGKSEGDRRTRFVGTELPIRSLPRKCEESDSWDRLPHGLRPMKWPADL